AKGPSVFAGYLDPEHSKGAFADGWFRTGDLGNLDAQGLLRITGRKKDIIVTPAGKNVYPEEIESVVLDTGLFL
ncbi:long-chain fatty acid--CoA ligase, partial [Vibrio parahaemolyticus]